MSDSLHGYQCERTYAQPFFERRWRFAWWLDDRLHRIHAPYRGPVRWLCDLVDAHVLKGFE